MPADWTTGLAPTEPPPDGAPGVVACYGCSKWSVPRPAAAQPGYCPACAEITRAARERDDRTR